MNEKYEKKWPNFAAKSPDLFHILELVSPVPELKNRGVNISKDLSDKSTNSCQRSDDSHKEACPVSERT